MPVTGRTNQIRIHFSKIGHPLVGEDKYAFPTGFCSAFPAHGAACVAFRMAGDGRGTHDKRPGAAAKDMAEFLERQKKKIEGKGKCLHAR